MGRRVPITSDADSDEVMWPHRNACQETISSPGEAKAPGEAGQGGGVQVSPPVLCHNRCGVDGSGERGAGTASNFLRCLNEDTGGIPRVKPLPAPFTRSGEEKGWDGRGGRAWTM